MNYIQIADAPKLCKPVFSMFSVSYKLFCGIAILFVAFIYTKWTQNITLPAQVIAAWQSRIKLPEKPFSRVAVG